MKKKSVCIWGANPKDMYSGGRYHALMMGEALALADYDVHYITNNIPIFARDFEYLESHKDINFYLTPDFIDNLPEIEFDYLFLIPGLGGDIKFYDRAIEFSKSHNSKLILLNFESANWFNELSPFPREEKLWAGWRKIAEHGDLILSSTKESNAYAKKFYLSSQKELAFEYCYPSLNSKLADEVYFNKGIKEKKIFMSTRFFLSDHKGANNISDLFCPEMKGYTFILMIGAQGIPPEVEKQLKQKASEFGINIDYQFAVSDKEKYELLSTSSLVLFPSFFEGFGYPPVESLYFDTACVAFDLPVLRETCGGDIRYARVGNWEHFREQIKLSLKERSVEKLHYKKEKFTLDSYGENLRIILQNLNC